MWSDFAFLSHLAAAQSETQTIYINVMPSGVSRATPTKVPISASPLMCNLWFYINCEAEATYKHHKHISNRNMKLVIAFDFWTPAAKRIDCESRVLCVQFILITFHVPESPATRSSSLFVFLWVRFCRIRCLESRRRHGGRGAAFRLILLAVARRLVELSNHKAVFRLEIYSRAIIQHFPASLVTYWVSGDAWKLMKNWMTWFA